MKNVIFFTALVILCTACNNGKRGSGNIVSENRTVNTFTKINASTSVEVDVTQGTQATVTVEADDNLIKYIETIVVNGELKIRIKNISIWNDATIKVHVVAPQIEALKASASASIFSNTTLNSTNTFLVHASSSANIDANINAPKVTVEASSSADVTLSGRTKEAVADASSSATININKLLAETVYAEASSSADVAIFASLKLIAKANSSGSITYTGGVSDIAKTENSSGTVSKQ